MKFFCLLFAICLTAGLGMAQNVVVTPGNMDGWSFYSTDSSGVLGTGSNTGQMVTGPATPPLGTGSANFITAPGGGDGSEQLRGGSSFDGTLISSLTSLSYSTYATSIGGDQLPYLQIYVNYNGGTTVDDRFVFEPVYSDSTFGGSQPTPALDTWQTWNAFTGKWYSNNGDPGGPGSDAVTLATIIAAHPNAVIVDSAPGVGGLRFTSGFSSSTDNYNTNIDDFTIGVSGTNTTFDFDPASAVPEPSTWIAGGLAAAMLVVQVVRARSFSKRAPVVRNHSV